MGDEKARIGSPRAFSSPIPVLFPFHPIHPFAPTPFSPLGLVPGPGASWARGLSIRPLRPRAPSKAPVPGKILYLHSSCRGHLERSDGRGLGVARGPGASPIFFPQPGLGASGGACAAARILVLRPPRPSHTPSRTNPKRLASRGPVCLCVCVYVCVCVCGRVCAPAFALACLLTQTRAHAHSSVCLWPH